MHAFLLVTKHVDALLSFGYTPTHQQKRVVTDGSFLQHRLDIRLVHVHFFPVQSARPRINPSTYQDIGIQSHSDAYTFTRESMPIQGAFDGRQRNLDAS